MVGISRETPWELQEAIYDEEGQFLILKEKLCQTELCLVGVYAPPCSQQVFCHKVFSHIKAEGETIMLRDFNAVFDATVDRSNCMSMPEVSRQFKLYL